MKNRIRKYISYFGVALILLGVLLPMGYISVEVSKLIVYPGIVILIIANLVDFKKKKQL